jgi:hypothetical protein
MQEAFIYAEEHDQENETPQYSSTPTGLGELLSLFGNLEGAYLILEDVVIDDDDIGASQGNGNGVIEFGETIELTVALHNMGLSDALGVTGALASASTYVNLLTGAGSFGDIPSGSTATNSQPFVFSVDSGVPNGEPLDLALNVTEPPDALPLEFSALAPTYVVSVSEIDDSGGGDGDGLAEPGEEVSLTVCVENDGGADSPDLTGVLEGDGYFTVPATPQSAGVIPIGGSVNVAGFVVQISPACPEIYSGQLTLVLSGPGSYSASTDFLFMVGPWFDNAETDLGWTLGVPGDDATTGVWVRLDPTGTRVGGNQVQPEDDHTPEPGVKCFVTGNAASGYIASYADVDGGRTTLLSPVFNMEGALSATLTYWRWYTNHLGGNPGQDYWDVDVTADGANWVHLEHTTESANTWTEYSFDLSAFIPLTATVRFRFVAADLSLDSLVEAAVDDILVQINRPPSAGVPASGVTPVVQLRLDECAPNPMNPSTSISFGLPAEGPVSIRIYDAGGRLVRRLLDRHDLAAGPHTVRWDGRGSGGTVVGSGVYFIRLATPDGEETGTVTLVR